MHWEYRPRVTNMQYSQELELHFFMGPQFKSFLGFICESKAKKCHSKLNLK